MLPERRKTFRGSLCLSMTKGHAAAPYGLVQAVLPASLEHCKQTMVVPQELGRTLFAPRRTSGRELPDYELQALAAHWSAWERNERVQPEVLPSEGTKRGRRAAGRHSVLIVLTKLANSPQLEPMEGSETSIHGTVFEKHVECFVIRSRVHETGADSRVGETVITAVSSTQGAWATMQRTHELRNRMR